MSTYAGIRLRRLLKAAWEIGDAFHHPMADDALAAERALDALHSAAGEDATAADLIEPLGRLVRRARRAARRARCDEARPP